MLRYLHLSKKTIKLLMLVLVVSGGIALPFFAKEITAGFYRVKGKVLEKQEKVDEAIVAYRQSIEVKSDNVQVYWDLGRVLTQKKNYDEAHKVYRQSIDVIPDNVSAYMRLANELQQTVLGPHSHELLAVFQKAIEIEPNHAEAYVGLGRTFNAISHLDVNVNERIKAIPQAIEAFKKAIKIEPKLPDAYAGLALALTRDGKLDAAIANYQKAIKYAPERSWYYFEIAEIFREKGKLNQAIKGYKKSIEISKNYSYYKIFESYMGLGDSLKQKGELDEAIEAYRNAIENMKISFISDYFYGKVYMEIGNIYYQQGKLDEANASYQEVLESGKIYPGIYNELGKALASKGELEKAIKNFQKAIDIKPTAYSYSLLANTLFEQEKLEEAIAQFRNAIQIEPQNSYAYNSIGNILKKQGKLEAALNHYQKAIEADKNNFYAYHNIGDVRYQQDKLEEALAAYQKAIEINPDSIHFYWELLPILDKHGKIDEVINLWKKAVEISFNHADKYLLFCHYYDHDGKKLTCYCSDNKRDAYSNFGDYLTAKERLSDAVEIYKQLIEIDPENKSSYQQLCYVLQAQGKLSEAIAQCQKSLAIDPNYWNAKFLLKEAERMLANEQHSKLFEGAENLPTQEEEPLVNLKRSIVKIIHKSPPSWGWGTGWVVKREGSKAWIVTNSHVVTQNNQEVEEKIEVEFYSQPPAGKYRQRQLAKVVNKTSAKDALDLALLEVNNIPEDIQPLPMSDEDVVIPTFVRSIGHPRRGNWKVFVGEYIREIDQKLMFSSYSAPGMSGSPVLTADNQVVGVLAKYQKECSGLTCALNVPLWTFENEAGSSLALPIKSVKERLASWGIE